MLELRGVAKVVQDFENICQFFENDFGSNQRHARTDNFEARVNNLKCVPKLLQYKVQVQGMVEALFSLDAITEKESFAIQQDAFISKLSTNFLVSEANQILDGVQKAVHGLTPRMCQVLGTLKKAHLVVASLRDITLKGENFLPAHRNAMTMAATDDHAKVRLDQLMKVRELIEPWLEQPVSFDEISDCLLGLIQNKDIDWSNETAKDNEADVLIRQIENVCRSWEHTLSFLNRNAGDVSTAARLVEMVPHYMKSGQYWGRLPEFGTLKGSIMLKFKIDADEEEEQHDSEWLGLAPENLLESIRFATLSIASTPDEASRIAMLDFKNSYTTALRLFHSYHELLQRHG
jgi:hypothetical protein